VTEAEWLACTDLLQMYGQLRSMGKIKDNRSRKFRLRNAACCRRIWPLLTDERSRAAIEVAERFVEGRASEAELKEAYQHASTVSSWVGWESFAAARTLLPADSTTCSYDAGAASQVCDFVTMSLAKEQARCEAHAQIKLLWDVFGNPFRPSLPLPPAVLAWNDGAIPKLAQAIYDERAFDRLPLLADALEQAGCHDADILAHCRHPGPHVRGCWVVDLLLGKE
jgi:hypothetical protein